MRFTICCPLKTADLVDTGAPQIVVPIEIVNLLVNRRVVVVTVAFNRKRAMSFAIGDNDEEIESVAGNPVLREQKRPRVIGHKLAQRVTGRHYARTEIGEQHRAHDLLNRTFAALPKLPAGIVFVQKSHATSSQRAARIRMSSVSSHH